MSQLLHSIGMKLYKKVNNLCSGDKVLQDFFSRMMVAGIITE